MDNNKFKCAMCGGQFDSQGELDEHAKQHMDQKTEEHSISCSKCGFKASSNEALETHAQQHGM